MLLVIRLIKMLGRSVFLSFAMVTFLVAELLATVNVTSRYALKQYVDDQLGRIRWDFALYQTTGSLDDGVLTNEIRSVKGIERVESLAFLRGQISDDEVQAEVDGNRITTPWICALAASDVSLLPPQLRFAMGNTGTMRAGAIPSDQVDVSPTFPEERADHPAVLALVGPERSIDRKSTRLNSSH